MSQDNVVIGIDFGTLSGRAVVVRVRDGEELASAEFSYPHGVMQTHLASSSKPLPPSWALQDANDYVEVLKNAVPQAIAAAGVTSRQVVGIGTDFTASTVLPVLQDSTPLSEIEEFRNHPHAYVKLWKHHSAQSHADRINAVARTRGETWLENYGGLLSSEWQLAKGLQILEEAPEIYDRMFALVEAADWIVWQMTGNYVPNACSAGYKGALQSGKYPSAEFFAEVNPDFRNFAIDKLGGGPGRLGSRAGGLTEEAASWMGLQPGTAVSVGNVDAHVTAPAAQAIDSGQMVAIMGTSTCHVVNGALNRNVPGMCGVVDGGIVEGLFGYEAGQSGVGDIFAWFVQNQVPAEYSLAAEAKNLNLHEYLTALAAEQTVGQHGLVALDWHSGNRSVLVDHDLSGVVVGMTLATRPEDIYRALLEATAFGTRKIIETFRENGVPIEELVVAGGLLKNRLLMQIYADVTKLPIRQIGSEQGPALGAAIHAAVASGDYANVREASQHMGRRASLEYAPNSEASVLYDRLYAEYELIHDYFGKGGNSVMRRLKALREEVLS